MPCLPRHAPSRHPSYTMNELFKLGDKVLIIPIERVGRIIGIYNSEYGIRYEIRYFDNAEGKSLYFFPDEIGKYEA